MPRLRLRHAPAALLIWLAVVVMVTGCSLRTASSSDREAEVAREAEAAIEGLPAEFGRLAEVWKLLQERHIDRADLDGKTLSDGAIRGMLRALDDPYAGYLTREQFTRESQDITGFFGGIGAEVGMRNGRITIIAPIPDTPAEEAGIRPGDVILEIDGETTQGVSILEAVYKIRGEQGTTVELLVLHRNSGESETIVITRGVIPLTSVRLLMQVGGIGHLRLSGFMGATADDLKEALDRFERSQGAGLILDLRNNPGGLVSSVVDVSSQFLEGGQLVLYQIDAEDRRRDWNTKSGGKALDVPLVVLVNEFSASASEVFAGAIMDHDRATVIGTATFGKGSVGNLWPLEDGSGINFTVARWFTPNGTLIEGEGITPNVLAEVPEGEADDTQLDQAIELLQELIASGAGLSQGG